MAGKDLPQDDQQQAYRLRLGVEGNRAIPLDNAALLTPSLGLFYRYDGGDGTTGSGLDLAAALRYDTPNGLRLESRGTRVLDKGKKGKPPLALACGLEKAAGEREAGRREPCCDLVFRLSRPCRGVRGRFPNQA